MISEPMKALIRQMFYMSTDELQVCVRDLENRFLALPNCRRIGRLCVRLCGC
jgi:hypothetical protein